MSDTTNLTNGTYYGQNTKMREGKNSDGVHTTSDAKGSLVHSMNVLNFKGAGGDIFETKASRYFDGKNATGYKNPTGSQIIKNFDGSNNVVVYKPQDFIFLEDYGNLPNNHLITLRRFSAPCKDDIFNHELQRMPDVGRVLSYLDGENNKIEDIFKFSAGFNWKQMKSEIQTIESSKNGFGGEKLNGFLRNLDTSGSTARENLKGKAATDFDPYSSHEQNYTWGPIDVIDEINVRERGLTFAQEFKLKFRYTVRSYNGISTKMVFLDILGNMLQIISNKGAFWGGAVRFTGGKNATGGLFDMKKLESGDMAGFLEGALKNISGMLTNPFKGGALQGLKSIAGNIGTGMLGGSMDKLGRPEIHGLHALLQGESTGEWHLMIGNPFNPSLVVGNLILKDATITPIGPFTVDDVPSTIELEVVLGHGMPRDKFAIQSMFNEGKGRYYSSDVDLENKSYYRNRGANGGSGGGQGTANFTDNAINSLPVLGNDTVEYTKALYSKAAQKTF